MLKRKKSSGFIAAISGTALLATGLFGASAASASSPDIAEAEAFFAAMEDYQKENPTDFEGLAEVAQEYGGSFQVSTNLTGVTSPKVAAQLMNTESMDDVLPFSDFPADVFTVAISSSAHPASTVVGVSGTVNWRDNFAGQAAPYDVASLSFSSQCGTLSGYNAQTYRVSGASTNLAHLRDGGAGTGAPTWNINAYTSGFENLADKTIVSVSYDKAGCGTSNVQAGFIHEGNQGGSIVSVSAGFMGLSVGYSSPGLSLQKGTQAITI